MKPPAESDGTKDSSTAFLRAQLLRQRACTLESPDETIVAVFPDRGERYLPTDLFPEPDLEE